MIFFLKTQGGWRETARLEHGCPDGGPVVVGEAQERLARFLAERSLGPAIDHDAGGDLGARET